MNRSARHPLLTAAALCLLALTFGCGKSAPAPERAAPSSHAQPARNWTSDPQASEAIKRENYVEAIQLLFAFVQTHPDDALAYYHLGYAFGRSGDQESEVKYYEKAVELGYTENNIYYNLGMAYGERKEYDKAERMFQRALSLDRSDAEPHFGLGLLRQSRGDDAGAERELLQTVALDPDHLEARATLALLYAKNGRRDLAVEQLKSILAKDPNHRLALELMHRLGAQP